MQAIVYHGPGQKDAKQMITHRFRYDEIIAAYETFASAGSTKALKVMIEV